MRRRVATLAATATFALALSGTPALAGSPAAPFHADGADATCTGGSIDPGTYGSIKVTGVCTVDLGSITVRHDLVVGKGAVLLAWYGGSNVTVGGDLRVEKDAVLVLGCGLPTSVCADDPYNSDPEIYPTYSATGSVDHDLKADGALAVIVHNTTVGHNVDQHGGGGGLSCDPVMFGSPAFSTYEGSTIGGSASISGVRTCWLGFLVNTVRHHVSFDNNVTVDLSQTSGLPDGNEIAGNRIGGNLSCAKNDPVPQLGDTGLDLNMVGHLATGQCAGLKV